MSLNAILPLTAYAQREVDRGVGLQLPGRDPCLRDVQYGGPSPDGEGGDPTDRRLMLDTATLRAMLAVAEASTTGRCVVHQVGLRVRQYRARGGHLYEIVHLVGSKPTAEEHAALRGGAIVIDGRG